LAAALAVGGRSLLACYERPSAEESALEVGLFERRRVGRKFYRMTQAEAALAMAATNNGL